MKLVHKICNAKWQPIQVKGFYTNNAPLYNSQCMVCFAKVVLYKNHETPLTSILN